MKNQKKKSYWMWVSVFAILSGMLSFFVTIRVYDSENMREESPLKVVAKNEETDKIDFKEIAKEEEKEEVIATIKSENPEKMVSQNEVKTEMLEEEKMVETVSTSVSKEENKPDELNFIWPISGEIGMEYALNELVYSHTLEEWITHSGIDILGEEAEPIKAIANGTIEGIKLDPRYGNTIIINHQNGYLSIYSNLSTTDLVYVGQNVKQGDIIAGVGKGVGYESKEPPHIHLEILFEGKNINPFIILNKTF